MFNLALHGKVVEFFPYERAHASAMFDFHANTSEEQQIYLEFRKELAENWKSNGGNAMSCIDNKVTFKVSMRDYIPGSEIYITFWDWKIYIGTNARIK